MKDFTRLDRVSIFGNKLSFLIPHDWVESFDEDHYVYRQPETESGWLRVSLITTRSNDEAPGEHLKKIFDKKENVIVENQTGNLVSILEKDSVESGDRIHLYYWMVANVVPPDLLREAVFSYTIRQDRIDKEDTKQMVRLVGQLVSQAEFCPPD